MALPRLGTELAPYPGSPPAIPSQLQLQLSTPLKTHRPKHPAPTAPPASFLRLYPNRSPSTATTAVLHLSGAVSDRDLTSSAQNPEIWKFLCPHCSVSESAIIHSLIEPAYYFA